MKDFLGAIENLTFTKEIDEFATEECVICMEKFQEGEALKRIPTCRHFFHPQCLEEWFKAKV